MNKTDQIIKRLFDMVLSSFGILLCWPLIVLCWTIAAIETRGNGFFVQTRIGRYGRPIRVIKIKTMYPTQERSAITAMHRREITRSGAWFRRCKLDELPQLVNVLIGDMSFVGPRPDVPGYADRLSGPARQLLALRPGITGPASLKYRHEEELLASVSDPVSYNDDVIWPDKVRINLDYLHAYSFAADLRYLWRTLLPARRDGKRAGHREDAFPAPDSGMLIPVTSDKRQEPCATSCHGQTNAGHPQQETS